MPTDSATLRLCMRTQAELLFLYTVDYSKRPIDYKDQISILQGRGLIVDNIPYAYEQLGIISYFRLAGYWRPMEADKNTHIFKSGSTFENAVSLYYFDKQLRALLFSVIQSIEIALRTKMIHHVSMKYGAFWFTDSALSFNHTLFSTNLLHVKAEIARSREDFIQDHFSKYTSPDVPPAWKALEVVSFGTLSKLYFNLNDNDIKKIIASEFHLPHRKFLDSWIKSMAVLRNIIAHHARLWNRNFPNIPLLPRHLPSRWIDTYGLATQKLYPQLCVLAYLENAIHPANSFVEELKRLLSKYPNVDVAAMGFPPDWELQPLWAISD